MNQKSELEKSLELLNSINKNNKIPVANLQNEISLNDYVTNIIKQNICSTITIKYEFSTVSVIAVYPSNTKVLKFEGYTKETYYEFCKEVLDIDKEEKYNCSRALNFDGVKTRVYSVQPPLSATPIITISTTKTPPSTLPKQTIPNEVWDEIVHSNFIICGASGSGKTYLFNYLLSKFINKDEKIALIEEFGELIPPNDLAVTITTPPAKPGETSLLKFITEQSNLMRLDATYIGEIKGSEAWPFIINLASGTRGGATVHGDTAASALNRLRSLCELSCSNSEAIDEFISKCIKYIIVMKDKNIEAIYKLTGVHNKNIFAMKEINS